MTHIRKDVDVEIAQLLCYCCRVAIALEAPNPAILPKLDADGWQRLCRLATCHDLMPLLSKGLNRLSLTPDESVAPRLERARLISLLRSEQIDSTLGDLVAIFSEAAIPHIPLRGALMRTLYPTRELRLCCDVDLLLPREEIAQAARCLVAHGYRRISRDARELTLRSRFGVTVELHHTILCDDMLRPVQQTLADPWDHASPSLNAPYTYRLSDEYFYLMHLSHMARHLYLGGCGLRPFFDLLLLWRKGRVGGEKERRRLLTSAHLADFEEKCLALARGESRSSPDLFAFILRGGVYGSLENRMALQRTRGKVGFRYLLRRIFPPFSAMKIKYPLLDRLPILTPLYYPIRILGCSPRPVCKRLRREIDLARRLPIERIREAERMLAELSIA